MRTMLEIHEIFQRYGGMMKTHELSNERLYYQNIQNLLDKGIIEKLRYGYYRWVEDTNPSEVDVVVKLFPDGILCMESALRYYGYIEEASAEWHIAVSKDSGKSRFNIDYPYVKPYYIEPSLLEVGMTVGEIDGIKVKVYDRERVICDCLRYRNRMDKEIFNNAIKSYINDSMRNIAHLNKYADELMVSQKARDLLAIWL